MHAMRFILSRMGGRTAWFLAAAVTLTLVMLACAQGADTVDLGPDPITGTDGGSPDVAQVPGDSSVDPSDSMVADDTATDAPATIADHVVINEMATGTAEFVELYNPTTSAVSLANWEVRYESALGNPGGAGHAFKAGDSIGPQAFLELSVAKSNWTAGMAKASGQIGLFNSTGTGGTLIDGVGYGLVTGGSYGKGGAAPGPPSNGSIGRRRDGADTGVNSTDFIAFVPGSPGLSN